MVRSAETFRWFGLVVTVGLLLLAPGCEEKEPAMIDTTKPAPPNTAKATFAAGCFWGVEATFRGLDGVVDTSVGYTGGHTVAPTYRDVCSGTTGHAEAVEVIYDPKKIDYEQLLAVFWACHDPTTLNRQGPDIGSQYRSAIFTHSDEQVRKAQASKDKLEKQRRYNRPIVTEITPAGPFYRAEEYHQRYLEKHGRAVCH